MTQNYCNSKPFFIPFLCLRYAVCAIGRKTYTHLEALNRLLTLKLGLKNKIIYDIRSMAEAWPNIEIYKLKSPHSCESVVFRWLRGIISLSAAAGEENQAVSALNSILMEAELKETTIFQLFLLPL